MEKEELLDSAMDDGASGEKGKEFSWDSLLDDEENDTDI
jgi:hypothetical protein